MRKRTEQLRMNTSKYTYRISSTEQANMIRSDEIITPTSPHTLHIEKEKFEIISSVAAQQVIFIWLNSTIGMAFAGRFSIRFIQHVILLYST